MEACLLSVPLPHIKHLADSGSKKGKILLAYKEDLSNPIAAILILNTVCNTIGATIAGAIVAKEYSETGVVIYSIFFTLLILFFSEILPKQAGASFSKSIAPYIAYPLQFLIKIFKPLIFICRYFSISNTAPAVSQAEVLSMAELGRQEGVIDQLEDSVIRNIIELDKIKVKDILTPRVVVSKQSEEVRVGSLKDEIQNWTHSRIPLHSEKEEDVIKGYVTQRDIFRALLSGNENLQLVELSRPITTVPELMRVDKLLLHMFEMKEAICAVVNKGGVFVGIVTLEDVIEEVVGREILDEYDNVSDLRSYAKILNKLKRTKK